MSRQDQPPFFLHLWVYFLLIISLKSKNNEVKNHLIGRVACNNTMQILHVPIEYHFQFASFLETLTHINPALTQV